MAKAVNITGVFESRAPRYNSSTAFYADLIYSHDPPKHDLQVTSWPAGGFFAVGILMGFFNWIDTRYMKKGAHASH